MTTFIPSPEQQAIFDAVLNTKDNVAIAALAGTGKTTSLVELSKRLPATGSKIFCAFNKDIVNELESRLTGTGVKASTFHSIGFSALKKHLNATAITPQGDKYKKLVEAWGNEDGVLALTLSDAVQDIPAEERGEKMRDLRKATLSMFTDLLNLARLKLANWDDIETLESIVWEYALDADVEHDGLIGLVLQNVEHIMKKAEEQTRKLVIDFTDMIYWGVKWNLRFYQYQWVLVDECQDLSPVQREMIARIISPNGGRIVLVGDPNQAIYAFAGADSDSFALSVERWNCKVLPLTMTRRCTSIITQHAARLVPSFRCPEDKPRGKVVWLPEDSLHRYAKVGDMVLSRIKAPLVEQCLNLIGEGIPAMILGADIGKALVAILEKLTKRKDYSFPELLKCLGNYCTEQMDIAKKKGDDARAEAIYDQCEAVKFVISAYPEAQSIDALTEKINSLFGDGKRFSEVVTFATIHKSKGLEAERVFILAPDKLPLRAKNMTPEQEQQEGNLDYVARTRAKHTLVYITNKKFLEKEARPVYVQEDFEDKVWDKPAPLMIEAPAPVAVETPIESTETFPSFHTAMSEVLGSIGMTHVLYATNDERKMCVSYTAKWDIFIVKTIAPDGAESNEIVTSRNDTLQMMKEFQPQATHWQFLTLDEWEEIYTPPSIEPVVDAVFKPDGLFVEAFTPETAEEQSTPLVEASAPLPFASLMKQSLTELLVTYDPDRGLCADGEITTMYITTDWGENYVIYERDYADEDDLRWSRDTKDKNAESVLKKMEALNANPDAWRIVIWGNWIDGIHDQDSVDEQESPAPVADEPPAVIEQPVIVVDEPPTPSADALLMDMLVEAMHTSDPEFGNPAISAIAEKLHQTIHPTLPDMDSAESWTSTIRSRVKVSAKRIMRMFNYPPESIDSVADAICHIYEHGTLPVTPPIPFDENSPYQVWKREQEAKKNATFEAVMTPRIRALVAGSNEGLFCNHETSSVFVHVAINQILCFEEYIYASQRHDKSQSNPDSILTAMKAQNSNPDEWALISFDNWYKSAVTHAKELEASQPITPVVAPVPDSTPADITPTFSNGENPPSYQNGKDTLPIPAPLPSTAPDMLKALIEQFRPFALPELDLVLQAIEYIKREKTEGAGV